MNKSIILALILTTLFQIFSKKTGIYWEYDEDVDVNKCVYCNQEDYDAAVETLKNDENVYIDNDNKDGLWLAYAYIFADNTIIITIFK